MENACRRLSPKARPRGAGNASGPAMPCARGPRGGLPPDSRCAAIAVLAPSPQKTGPNPSSARLGVGQVSSSAIAPDSAMASVAGRTRRFSALPLMKRTNPHFTKVFAMDARVMAWTAVA